MMTFTDTAHQDRKRDCNAIVDRFLRISEDSTRLGSKAGNLKSEISKLEDDLRAIDERLAKELNDSFTIDSSRKGGRGSSSSRKGRGTLEDQLDELQDALGGLELGIKLGDDLQRRYLDDLEGDGATLSFRNPAARLALVGRLDEAREELRQTEAQLETNRAHFEELRGRFSARRCSDFDISPALMMHLPPPRRP